ncbi:HTTM domain-containing protein [Natronobacterium gregoryi]|uniref:HTTM domain-containing protein n=2 Tax=Natronobacterium gregoryi TaxID=44930 RepID=L0AGI6_NATGS|nr:HTTM domain-containing protein [Natronobacterium gregoryi]AFZ72936.1 Vitamin K-dependent gamma-carboxylase [Natronobacterium gregoryi SP2]ELY69916.1 HTTM domain-containing protein [Natronobacterium gregoryi SP2]PLK21838.1 HTTM domain-containing protein [Natronobacterium gregoryi SP2]SFI67928.1 Vitamin K-dependent gamma-carboxylase [Natronobacterium gregoryi]
MTPSHRRDPDRSVAVHNRLWTALQPVRRHARARLEVDTRALAALRIALGSIVLFDLFHRAGSLETFYTNAGVYPLEVYQSTYSRYTGFSLHAASGEVWFQQLLFVIAGAFAVALILGYRTRLVGFVSLVLLLSLHARNPAVLNGADQLLRVLLIVALLTPLGERWSVDALRRGSARTTVVTFGTVALLAQPVVVFTQNAILKHEGDSWYAGEGITIAFASDEMTIFLGNHLGSYPALLELFNWVWITLLAGSGAFLLLTRGWQRVPVVFVYLGAFGGLLLSVSVGLFPLVLAAAVLPFLPTQFWDALEHLVPSRLARFRPRVSWLGPLERPPLEWRALGGLRRRGHGQIASFVTGYARSVLTVAGFLVLVWMLLFGATHASSYDVPDEIYSPHLDEQRWGLYAPDPSESYGWFGTEARLENGSAVGAFGDENITADRPPDAAQEYENFRERKYLESVRDSGTDDSEGIIATSYADWACEQAVDEYGEDELETVTLYRFIQSKPLEGEYEEAPQHYTVVERSC